MNLFKPYRMIAIGIAVYLLLVAFIYADPEIKIDSFLSVKSFSVHIQTMGCFGGDTAVLHVFNNGQCATYTYKDWDSANQPYKKAIQITWNAEKQKLLREFFVSGLSAAGDGWCTNSTRYILVNAPYQPALKMKLANTIIGLPQY